VPPLGHLTPREANTNAFDAIRFSTEQPVLKSDAIWIVYRTASYAENSFCGKRKQILVVIGYLFTLQPRSYLLVVLWIIKSIKMADNNATTMAVLVMVMYMSMAITACSIFDNDWEDEECNAMDAAAAVVGLQVIRRIEKKHARWEAEANDPHLQKKKRKFNYQ
jgi:hypothetical protein